MFHTSRLGYLVAAGLLGGFGWHPVAAEDAGGPIRSQAVLDIPCESESPPGGNEPAGTAPGTGPVAAGGVQFVNDPVRVPSPFWGQTGRRALRLVGDRQQFFQIVDRPDLSRSPAVSLGFHFLSLVDERDTATHGLVTRRSDSAGVSRTHYGIDFTPGRDALSVYSDDGTGRHAAEYSFQEYFGQRRRAFLTMTLDVGDAPAPDDDPDHDDVLVRLYVNGEPALPRRAERGQVNERDVWLTDIDSSRLLHAAPLIIGSITATGGYASGVIDEFLLFPRALTAHEVATLFEEVAGPNAAELARHEQTLSAEASQRVPPQLTTMSQYGLQAGKTTEIVLHGRNLSGRPRVFIPVTGVVQRILPASTAEALRLEITVPQETPAGIFPLRVQTDQGLTSSLPLSIDRLVERLTSDSSPENPADLPAAFSGNLAASERPRIYFRGRAGQRIVADLEVKRLGSAFEPVLELCDPRGVPLKIEWRRVPLHGDARIELALPGDGVYFVEVHDLRFRAPAYSPFRVKIGDLMLIDAFYPPVAATGASVSAEPIGTGIAAGSTVLIDGRDSAPRSKDPPYVLWKSALARLPDAWQVTGSVPPVRISSDEELFEGAGPPGQPQVIDARFSGRRDHSLDRRPVAVCGRISKPGEEDQYAVLVTPGQRLKVSLQARAFDSPLDGQLVVLRAGDRQRLATSPQKPASADPQLEVTVPDGVDRLLAEVSDLAHRGGPRLVYRLEIAPAASPNFRVTLLTREVVLPSGGSALVELDVEREGYRGPIQLRAVGNSQISIQPGQCAADGRMVATLVHAGGESSDDVIRVQIVAESLGHLPTIRRVASFKHGTGGAWSAHPDVLPVAVTRASGPGLDVGELPTSLVMGLNAELPLVISSAATVGMEDGALRFSLLTNERPRPQNPFAPDLGNKPLVRTADSQTVSLGEKSPRLTVVVPTEVEQPEIEFVVRGEFLPHAFSDQVLGTTYSRPFRLKVNSAIDVQFEPDSLQLTSEQKTKLRGKIQRQYGFTGAVEIALNPLPIVYQFESVKLGSDQEQFELPVTPGKFAEEVRLPFARVIVTATEGGAQLVNKPLPLRLLPAKPQ